MFAERLQWPPYVTEECAADYIDEQIAFWEAQATHAEEQKEAQEKEAKKQERKRKRDARRRKAYGETEIVDIDDPD